VLAVGIAEPLSEIEQPGKFATPPLGTVKVNVS
jgi:hypothetical protein